MEIRETFLTQNPCFKAGKTIAVKGLMLHSVGCPQPKAEVFMKNWNRPESSRACVHAFIDGNTGEVYQTLPWDRRAWHCGGKGNGAYIGVEMCEPGCIQYKGGSSFDCSDQGAAMEVVKRTYEAAVELFAFLCRRYGLDPVADGVIISHKEGHARGLASGHGDPEHLWQGMGTAYTMDGFRLDVAAALAGRKTGRQTEIKAGDRVKVSPEAVYYTGKEMPDWVKGDSWRVKSVSGDRAVLGENESGRDINSPVSVKYLTADRDSEGNDAPGKGGVAKTGQDFPPPASPSGEMTVSHRGVELIAKYEGCRLEAYKCPAGVWTIGYGHTAGVTPGQRLPSKEAAKALLREDLKKYGGYVNACVKKGILCFPLTQNQFDALTSFCYNCGNGSLQKLVAGRDSAAVADKLLLYNKGGGKVLPGLTRRREEERDLFLS